MTMWVHLSASSCPRLSLLSTSCLAQRFKVVDGGRDVRP
jgi:hypothetical protein